METRSIFSVNTNQTGFKGFNAPGSNLVVQLNQLHQFFHRILPTFSKQCPYLSKIFYLQLILRQNILIFTQNRVDARDIWLYLSRMLQLKKPQIYVVDDKININQLLNTKNEYQRILLYDISKLSTQIINKLLNSQSQISLLGIQNPGVNVSSHILDLFTMVVMYNEQQQISHLVDTYNQQIQIETARNFDKKLFNECVKLNFQIVMQQTQEQGFLRPFLQVLESKLDKVKIKISQSKWKKMLKILKFIGVNKQEGLFKKMSLSDFILSPELLASNIDQIKVITQSLVQSLVIFIPYYGIQKFEKGIKNHFWFSKNHFNLSRLVLNGVKKECISFLYPCIKFPQTASIKTNTEDIFTYYQIKGYQKKLMSDHHYQIEPENNYTLSLNIRSNNKMVVHLGIACYDKLKNIILPVQACRRQNSSVTYLRMQGNRLSVKNASNLLNWSNQKDNFAYERAIGVYINGQTSQMLPVSQILYNNKEAYSKNNRPYQNIVIDNAKDEGQIVVSQDTRQWFVNFRHLLEKNKTILMNHFEGGVGCIGQSLNMQESQEWRNITINYHGSLFSNTGRNFFPSTKFVRIVIMVNYNSGFPDFNIHNKNAQFQFKDITFKCNS